MDPESKKLLEQTFELTKENNEMLHKVRRVQKRTALFSLLRLLVIIGIAFGVFIYVEPYLTKIMNLFTSFGNSGVQGDSSSLMDLIKNFGNIPK
jgi:zona occludens toxin (predicted ATPase)